MFSKELFAAYAGKKVMICGASCLTGRNLFDLMQLLGAQVRGTCYTQQHYYADGKPMFRYVDFTDSEETALNFASRYDYVFICAAQSYNANVCRENPEVLIGPNLLMISNILKYARESRCGRVMFLSSAVAYQKHDTPQKEDDLDWNQNPHSIYMSIGWVKRYLEKLCEFYSQKGLPCTIVRLTNVYGRYDKTDPDKCHVIPSLLLKAVNREDPFILESQGNGVKNFVYVNDVVRDMAKAMIVPGYYNIFNLTGEEFIKIGDLAHLVIEVAREYDPTYNPRIIFEGYPDACAYVGLSREKFDSICGKDTYTLLKRGLKETLEWLSLLLPTQKK